MKTFALLILTLLPVLVSAKTVTINYCASPNIEVSLKHFTYCASPEQTSKLSFHTFSDATYSLIINDKRSELFFNWLPASIALAGLPKKYGLTPRAFLEQLFDGTVQQQNKRGQEISAIFGQVDGSELYVQKRKESYIFSALSSSGQNTAFLLSENSDWLLQVDGQFDKQALIQVIDRTRLIGSL
ncbi:hypothetical protein [Pseudoalteromonas luteoviolacea]|uniref:Chalcone isomerase domain-containing protein n=1 Tax=Pseudoalteromonas luteoviolacea S4054 TaxID=1129367 RepID=A0A0F6ABQ7_9GAMM|nr:hypothetical protein [Pseudoalteromonas luteoviolacea]AOT09558.1 hypothetical protein S4054249_17800 [Pseudoalteromonas luteoviolacea]AOT14470.1 hypothetical protein S40542_17770 [Pseudoalteromonas luteoviolacea]AOT19385.1 hypothetical protein S4054_17775 [Pseudoalteromonas luteoviolacea]KKE83583.1 hypothetical protein N479_13520 [Pseudoalteromonas luteoviolacea S4054]KZN69156.1 hypothetical protein N481_22645 [Pseudoalteromonas luteoviolacea S4047-1]